MLRIGLATPERESPVSMRVVGATAIRRDRLGSGVD